ncbi:hypothetical protein B0I35DRAFT_514278 [Stachybotrys elegans]|uniref:Uncharacterized protein n=1 Tax=Stachybotrys elegans TaxID=80388 RepID=A0A8K0WN51_9HYPO|nr:hypothetical protein B0I35DRAFT_514278 [Stachybotrys elegans]
MAVVKDWKWRRGFANRTHLTSSSIDREPQSYLAAWIVGLVFCLRGIATVRGKYNGRLPSLGGFESTPTYRVKLDKDQYDLYGNLILANSPQLVITLVYIFYNHILTTMTLGHEYSRFASTRAPLRVTCPYGKQHDNRLLQIPYRYILPVMITMIFVHSAVARSFYVVDIKAFDLDGKWTDSYISCYYSFGPMILALSLTGILLLFLIGLSFRRLDPGIPVAGSCSLAISAASHPSEKEVHPAALPLQYGVMKDVEPDELGRRRVGFSSREVDPLVAGEAYI